MGARQNSSSIKPQRTQRTQRQRTKGTWACSCGRSRLATRQTWLSRSFLNAPWGKTGRTNQLNFGLTLDWPFGQCPIIACASPVQCGVSEIAIHSLRSNWPGARREGGSVSAVILDRLSNEAPGQFQSNPKATCLLGGGGVARSLQIHCGICYGARAEAPRAWPPPKIHGRECIVISETPH